MPRELDWRAFLNRLVYCHGCGKFGLPRKGKAIPSGWKVLYQPHADAPPGLHVCTRACEERVREAIQQGPVTEPLQIGTPPMMDAGLRQQMMDELFEEADRELDGDRKYIIECEGCGSKLDTMDKREKAIPQSFSCPRCGTKYQAHLRDGGVSFSRKKEQGDDGTVPRSTENDSGQGDEEG